MNYCSLEDAFGSPGCSSDAGAKEARKEERRKAKRCKGPQATFLGLDKDPDRQNVEKTPCVPAMNPQIGLRQHVPVTANQADLEPFQNQSCESESLRKDQDRVLAFEMAENDDEAIIAHQRKYEWRPRDDGDPVGDKQRATRPNPASLVSGALSSFFGKDPMEERAPSGGMAGLFSTGIPTNDGFADYIPDSKNYLMEPNFTSAFTMTPGAKTDAPTLPIPSVRDVWKPTAYNGANTSFLERLPPAGGTYPKETGVSHESLSRKIDTIMERLDSMGKRSPEQTQTDILLFVSSGIFVLFMMDLLVRKGSSLKFLKGF
jgi:hypothetical protein